MEKNSLFSEEKRRKILVALEDKPIKFVDLKRLFGFESNILSYNLNILIKNEIVAKEGVLYNLTDYGRYVMPYVHKSYDASSIPIPCVAVIVRKGSKILIRKKDREPEKGKSIFVGGKMNFGEQIYESCRREVQEKVGIKIKNLKIICVNNYVARKNKASAHYVVFFVTAEPIGKPKNSSWQHPENVEGDMFPDNKFILKNMLQNKEVKIHDSVYDEEKKSFRVVNIS